MIPANPRTERTMEVTSAGKEIDIFLIVLLFIPPYTTHIGGQLNTSQCRLHLN